jgi:hypothetical protein
VVKSHVFLFRSYVKACILNGNVQRHESNKYVKHNNFGGKAMVSEKQLEEVVEKVLDLINDAKFSLIIPRKAKYGVEELAVICENWNKACDKIEKARETVSEVICQAMVEIPAQYEHSKLVLSC